jgi:subtilisin family serine protease
MRAASFKTATLLLTLSTCLLQLPVRGQSDADHLYFYRIYFTDKNASPSDFSPEQLLSPAAVARREAQGIPVPELSDLPVSPEYINTVTEQGLTYRCASRWMNTALFTSPGPRDIKVLEAIPSVDRVKLVKHPAEPAKGTYAKYGTLALKRDTEEFDPRVPLNGIALHQSGFTGRGVTIAVLDAGFANADRIESLTPLMQRRGVRATRDFVRGSDYVYDYHNHGTSVLSILAGNLPGLISGTAPGADYILLRTEDDASEYPVEEDYWAAGAEFADSAGADIITSSLGYFTFDDPSMSYSFSDMDGNSTFVTQAADMAASKGIVVIASAGNERNKEWLRILAPSDGNGVVSVGAVTQELTISNFSSAGYSYDGRVKPDVVAPGVSLTIQFEPDLVHRGSGTSFSCPVISGLTASLMQAVPKASPPEIIAALHESSDRFLNPDSLYGYGLPDFLKTLRLLEDIHSYKPDEGMTAGPNPFFDEINIWFPAPPGHLSVTVTTTDGTLVMKRHYPLYAARSYRLGGFGKAGQGLYLVKVETEEESRIFKMIRLSR